MSSTRIFFIVFLITAVGSGFYLFNSINSSIQQSARIADAEKQIIEQLKLIREAELAYISVNGQYTSDWNKLIEFINKGVFYVIEKKETITEESYGVETVTVEIDTLGTVPVYDSVFSKYKNFNADRLPYVPVYKNVKFKIVVNKIDKSGVMVDVIEVWNPKPVNPERDEESEYTSKKPLRFGSQYSVTTSGNWE
jgi:hypothetical protein